MNKKEGNYVFTPAEFWLLILLLVFVAIFIGYASFENAGNGSALNYVSFAATLISIILALVAIGYTYGESVAERSKVDKLSQDLSTLSEISDKLARQADVLDKIDSIRTGMALMGDDLAKAAKAEELYNYMMEGQSLDFFVKSPLSAGKNTGGDDDNVNGVDLLFGFISSESHRGQVASFVLLWSLVRIYTEGKPLKSQALISVEGIMKLYGKDEISNKDFMHLGVIYSLLFIMLTIGFFTVDSKETTISFLRKDVVLKLLSAISIKKSSRLNVEGFEEMHSYILDNMAD